MAFLGHPGMRRHLEMKHQYDPTHNICFPIPRLIFSLKLSALKASVIPGNCQLQFELMVA